MQPSASYNRVYKKAKGLDSSQLDEDDHELEKYEELIPISKDEASKSKFDMMQEIFNHTEQKVLYN